MKKIIVPSEIAERIVSDYKKEVTISEISRRYNYNTSIIRRVLKEYGVYKRKGNYGVKYNWSDDDIADIIRMYTVDNMSSQAIGDIYRCYDSTILNLLNNNGIDTTRKREDHNFTKYKVDESFFDNIDNEEKAYWFGFLLADGHVTDDGKILLTLQSRDYSHLKKFTKSLKSNHPIHKHYMHEAHGVHIGSSKLSSALREKGFNRNKSWGYDVITVISSVPEDLTHHFIRGYFDGDGCVGIYKQTHYDGRIYHFSILGIKEFLEFIMCQVDLSWQLTHDKRTYNTYQLVTKSKMEISRIYDYLYKDSSIFMNRKHDIFEEILSV